MLATGLKQLLKRRCPTPVWGALRWLSDPVLRRRPVRVVRTLEALDRELDLAAQAAKISHDAFRNALAAFRFEPSLRLPHDPQSHAYHEAQMALYRLVSGRASYSPKTNEQSDIQVSDAVKCPFPYGTGSTTTVGEQLMAIGFLVRELALPPGGSVLEFGPGWGNTTLELARMGLAVTAVDVEPRFVQVIRERAHAGGLAVELACADMLGYRPGRRFDRVLFYECFHHCADPVRMIAALDKLVAEGGAAIFAGEPIEDQFPVPWGLRCDGLSLWSIRKYGWLELGFRTSYFRRVLAQHGWTTECRSSHDVPWQRVFVARHAGHGQ